ncbi:MAG: hypothetical protein QMD12_00915 [Candidatus Aenigmarchaeota archaeon]|nr:hypothetical protein [Candidatus Aenigmarchaeota archaeon]
MSEDLKEIFKDSDALAFLIYKGLEGAVNGLEEYRICKKNSMELKNKILKKSIKGLLEEYIDKLPFFEKLAIKTFLSLPWSETIKLFSDFALSYGKKDDGTYKSTFDTVVDGLKKYFG